MTYVPPAAAGRAGSPNRRCDSSCEGEGYTARCAQEQHHFASMFIIHRLSFIVLRGVSLDEDGATGYAATLAESISTGNEVWVSRTFSGRTAGRCSLRSSSWPG